MIHIPSPHITEDPNYESFAGFLDLVNSTKQTVEGAAAKQLKQSVDAHLEALTTESRNKLIAYIRASGRDVDRRAKGKGKARV